ncbi:MAG: cysteine--tRNA ligase [Patescibacteria group bacterium]
MKLFNTMAREKEELISIEDKKIRLYTCGPTVYDAVHIGNLRAYVVNDLLKRTLTENGYNVTHVINITDVDDKTIRRSEGKKAAFEKLVKKYEEKFWSDMDELNNLRPTNVTRATQYIDKIVSFIEDLVKKSFAYKSSDGSVYFSIEKFKDYGKLSRLDKSGIKSGARVSQDEYDKQNPSDFALWKAWTEEDGEIYWETSLGKGRPGWSIECSAMSMDVLGETLDIHTGGVDLIFPHHENEIAQSEAKTGKKFVNYWVHNEHLLVDNTKMAKSLGNFFTLDDIKQKGFSSLDFRYLVLGAHYRSKLNFTWKSLTAAKNSRERLNNIVDNFKDGSNGNIDKKYYDDFIEEISDDIDVPGALAVLWNMLRDENIGRADKYKTALLMDKVFGLDLGQIKEENIPQEITKLAEERKGAKANKDFQLADEIREKIKQEGWSIEDLENNEYKLAKSL